MDGSTLAIVVGAAVVAGILLLLLLRARGRAAPMESAEVGESPEGLGRAIRRAFGRGLDSESWGTLEEILISSDMGMEATDRVVAAVRSQGPTSEGEARRLLTDALVAEFDDRDRTLNLWGDPAVILVVGVNGSGKTTSVAKLAHRLASQGRSVVMAAADTFRAAGSDQLEIWGERMGLPVVKGQEGGDPAAVVHDAMTSARARGADVVVVDTAGRLHGNRNLMAELGKIHRVAGGSEGVGEVLLVIDATAGQNGLMQAKEFAASVPLTGVILAKLDGTARGGIVVAVESSLGVPVKLVGTGETIGKLEPFDPARFVQGLLET